MMAEDRVTTLTCQKCGREGMQAILACPERAQGRCPFRHERDKVLPLLGWVVFGTGMIQLGIGVGGALGLLIANRTWGLACCGLCGIPSLAMAAAFIGLGLVMALGSRVRLRNEESGELGHQITFGGRVLYQMITEPAAELPSGLRMAEPLQYPASVTAILLHPPARSPRSLIYWSRYAVELILTSMVSLLAGGQIVMTQAVMHRWVLGMRWGREPKVGWFLVPGPHVEAGEEVGALERRIVRAVREWPKQRAARTWPQGIPSHRVATALVEHVRWNPGRWVYQVVERDAKGRGLLPIERAGWQDVWAVLEREGAMVEAWLQELSAAHPDAVREWRSDLWRGLSFMEWDYLEMP